MASPNSGRLFECAFGSGVFVEADALFADAITLETSSPSTSPKIEPESTGSSEASLIPKLALPIASPGKSEDPKPPGNTSEGGFSVQSVVQVKMTKNMGGEKIWLDGVVHWIGKLPGRSGIQVGVELFDAYHEKTGKYWGNTDGSYADPTSNTEPLRYFTCEALCGLFMPHKVISSGPNPSPCPCLLTLDTSSLDTLTLDTLTLDTSSLLGRAPPRGIHGRRSLIRLTSQKPTSRSTLSRCHSIPRRPGTGGSS